MSAKLNANAILKAAKVENKSDKTDDEYLKSQLEGAVVTLKGVNIDPKALGMSEVNTLVMAKGIRTARESESLAKKKEEFRTFKNVLAIEAKKLVDSITNKQELATESAGVNPAGSIGSKTIELTDGRKVSARITALRLNPDDKKLKDLKTTKDLMAKRIEDSVTEVGLKKVVELLEFEAGTKESKTISVLSTDAKSKSCIKDEEFKYQVSYSLVPEKEKDD